MCYYFGGRVDINFQDYLELKILSEGISIQNDELVFDYKNKDGLSSSFGKGKKFTPYEKKASISGNTIYSVYNVKDLKGAPTIKAIKSGVANSSDYRHFIKRTAIFISSKILKKSKPDIVITPASTSFILNDLIEELKSIMPHVKFLKEKFSKVLDPKKITIDLDHPKITDKIIDVLESILKRAKRDGYFQLKKVLPQNRKFLKNYFNLIDDYKYEKIKGKNIVLLDDVVSSGSTFEEMIRIIEQYGPNTINGVTIFKTK